MSPVRVTRSLRRSVASHPRRWRGCEFAIWLIPLVLVCVGCQQTVYRIDMRFKDGRLHRRTELELTVRSEPVEPPAADIARLTRAFQRVTDSDVRVETKSDRVVIEADLDQRTPQDVGGFGNHVVLTSRLGALETYLERFGGDEGMQANLQYRHDQIDLAVDRLVGFLRETLSDDSLEIASVSSDSLKQFANGLDGPVRQDLHDMLTMVVVTMPPATPNDDARWVVRPDGPELEAADGDSDSGEASFVMMATRILSRLIERGYCDASDAPTLMRLSRGRDPHETATICLRCIGRRIDADDATVRDWIGFATDPQTRVRLGNHLSQLPEFKELQHPPPPSDAADPEQLISTPILMALLGPDMSPNASIELRFHSERPPLATNGVWDPERSLVQWKGGMATMLRPMECFAIWSRVDDPFQQSAFGEHRLKGRELMDYVLWQNGLDESESDRWDGLLDRLVSEPSAAASAKQHLADFENGLASEQDAQTFGTGVRLIRDALR